MKRLLGLLLVLVLSMAMASCASAEGEPARAEMTVMLYFCGADLESRSGWASQDIGEAMQAQYDPARMNVCLAVGGALQWEADFPNDRVTEMCLNPQTGEKLVYGEMPGASMGDASTLSKFINDSVERYPADRYALVFWDHGGGPVQAMCLDETQGDDGLLMSELRAGLEASPFGPDNQLEWIIMDECLMGSVEVASVCAPYAKYMIASEEISMSPSFDYATLLTTLPDDLDGAATGRRVTDSYMEEVPKYLEEHCKYMVMSCNLTMSVIDLSKIGAVEDAVDALFTDVEQPVDADSFVRVAKGRTQSVEFGKASGVSLDIVDLRSMAEHYLDIAPAEAQALLDAIDNAVVYNRTTMEGASGLSMYYPHYTPEIYLLPIYDDTITGLMQFRDLGFAPNYADYLDKYVMMLAGAMVTDWTSAHTGLEAHMENGHIIITLPLTDGQQRYMDSAQLQVMRGTWDTLNEGYFVYDFVDDLPIVDGALTLDYTQAARRLAPMDETGRTLQTVIYGRDGEYIYIPAVLANYHDDILNDDYTGPAVNVPEDQRRQESVWIVARETDDHAGLDLVNVISRGEREVRPARDRIGETNSGLNLDENIWPVVRLMNLSSFPEKDQDGNLMPADSWSTYTWYGDVYGWAMFDVDNTLVWTLAFVEDEDTVFGKYAQVVITDIQGNRIATELVKLPNPLMADTEELGTALYESGIIRVGVEEIGAYVDGDDKGILIRTTWENNDAVNRLTLNYTVRFNGEYAVIDDTYTDEAGVVHEDSYNAGRYDTIEPSNASSDLLMIPYDALPEGARSHIDSIAFELKGEVTNSQTGETMQQIGGEAGEGGPTAIEIPVDMDLTALN